MRERKDTPHVEMGRDTITIRCGECKTILTRDEIRIQTQSRNRPDAESEDDLKKSLFDQPPVPL